MKLIWLTKGQFTLIDDDDYIKVCHLKWYAQYSNGNIYAARRNGFGGNIIYMHRLILGLTDSKVFTDHKDRNGLNNRKENLRIATFSQNMANRKSHSDSNSKYLGVHWHKRNKTWNASIVDKGQQIHIGSFKSEIEAALAYNDAAIKIHGEFANLNSLS